MSTFPPQHRPHNTNPRETHSHQDDQAKLQMAQDPSLKHSYVISLAEMPSPSTASSATPTSQTHIINSHHSHHPRPLSPVALLSPQSPTHDNKHTDDYDDYHKSPPASPFSPSSPLSPRPPFPKAHTSSSSPSHFPRSTNGHPFARHTNASQLTLGFSGRPQSRFKFWTSVTADPTNRDSWLEGQRRKRRHRSWVCWGFWVCLLVLVGGVVATVLVLREKGIIKI